MEAPPYQIWITTYEISKNGLNPTLSHVFYGKTLKEAYGYARSHLITDYFFSSSFVGSMSWKGSILRMTNGGKVTNIYHPENVNETKQIMSKLNSDARKINGQQIDSGMIMVIQEVAHVLPKN